MKKIISLLIVVCLVAFTFVCCGDDTNEESNSESISVRESYQESETHSESVQESESASESIPDTGTVFVKDGSTDFKIVIPDEATNYEKNSATVIADYIELATDVRLGVYSESNVDAYDGSSKYIMVGNTVEAQNLGVDYSSDILTTQGFKIITDGDSTFLLGGSGFGTLFSAYEFLKYYINMDVVAVDEINYDRSNVLYVKELNVTEVPDIEYRVSGNRQTYDSSSTAQLMRYITASGNGFISINGRIYHNCFEYLPPNVYNNPDNGNSYHPLWYTGSETNNERAQSTIQLCYSAHGDTEEYNLMQETCLQVLKSAINTNPNINNIQLSMADNGKWCTCDACKEYRQKYGTIYF